jgi:hypothetical protein
MSISDIAQDGVELNELAIIDCSIPNICDKFQIVLNSVKYFHKCGNIWLTLYFELQLLERLYSSTRSSSTTTHSTSGLSSEPDRYLLAAAVDGWRY